MSGVRRLSRRSFVGRVLGTGTFGALALIRGEARAAAQACTDRDRDRPGHRGNGCPQRIVDGCTDRDPYDAPGRGRCGRRRRRGACADRDPHDAADPGRSCR